MEKIHNDVNQPRAEQMSPAFQKLHATFAVLLGTFAIAGCSENTKPTVARAPLAQPTTKSQPAIDEGQTLHIPIPPEPHPEEGFESMNTAMPQ